MKNKGLVVGLVVGLSLLALGGAVVGISIAAAGSWTGLSTCDPYVDRVIDVTSSTVDIEVDDDNNKISLVNSATAETVSILVRENENEYYVSNEDENAFTLEYTSNIPWNIRLFYYPVNSREMIITVPDNYDGSINVKTTNSQIDVDDLSITGKLDLESVNGSVSVTNTSVGNDLGVYTTNSAIYVDEVVALGDIGLHSTNGLIDLDDVKSTNLTAATTNGKVKAELIDVSNKMHLSATNGSLVVSDIDVDVEIKLETTNGMISGDVKGPSTDYDVNSQTTNGTNNLAGYNSQIPTTANKVLYARTYNGSINITFK